MLENPKESQCPGTPSAETATAVTCIMPACTVHITPVNSIHTHTHNRHMHPNVHTTHEHTHSTIHNANNLNHLPLPITLKDIHTTAHDAPIVNNPVSEHHTQNALSAPTGCPPSSRPPSPPPTPHLIHQHSPLTAITDNLSRLLLHPPPSPLASKAPLEQHTTHAPTPPLSPLQLYDLLSPHLHHYHSLRYGHLPTLLLP
jgi:hypothetical protein